MLSTRIGQKLSYGFQGKRERSEASSFRVISSQHSSKQDMAESLAQQPKEEPAQLTIVSTPVAPQLEVIACSTQNISLSQPATATVSSSAVIPSSEPPMIASSSSIPTPESTKVVSGGKRTTVIFYNTHLFSGTFAAFMAKDRLIYHDELRAHRIGQFIRDSGADVVMLLVRACQCCCCQHHHGTRQ